MCLDMLYTFIYDLQMWQSIHLGEILNLHKILAISYLCININECLMAYA